MTGNAQKYVQIGKVVTYRIREVILRPVHVKTEGIDLDHVQTFLGKCHRGGAGEDLGGIFAEEHDHPVDAARMTIDQIGNIIYHAMYNHPILASL